MAARRPSIARIVRAAPRQGTRGLRRVRPADVLVVEGDGFGRRPDRCTVLFDDVEVAPHAVGFAPDALVVTAPLPPSSTTAVRVRVGERTSEPLDCRLVRPRGGRAPAGSEIRAYYGRLDELAAMTSAAAAFVAPMTAYPRELRQAASTIDGHRASVQLMLETLDQLAGMQATLDGLPDGAEGLDSIRLLDDHLRAAGAVGELVAHHRLLYGAGGRFDAVLSGTDATCDDVLLGRAGPADEVVTDPGDAVVIFGFTLHEVTKALEGVEDLFDLRQPSLSVGVEIVALDVTVDFGGPLSALAKGIDLVGQYIFRGAEDATLRSVRLIDLKVDRLEGKLDRLDGRLDDVVEIVSRIDGNVLTVTEGLVALRELVQRLLVGQGQLESKADRAEQALAAMEAKADRATTERATIVELLGLLEGKADATAVQLGRQEEKLDRLEGKADTAETKLDRLEGKADTAESKLDRLEQKGDIAETKLDRLEGKADVAETKLDRLEQKGDTAETKLDRLEGKADVAESKLDRLEQKGDTAETKLDRLEGRADRAEEKLDRLEGKADVGEEKLDRLTVDLAAAETKLDRQETKADVADDKLDRIERKVDEAGRKLDRLEVKTDALEAKADRAELKLDRHEVKLDLLDRPTAGEGAVAGQRGGGDALTAVVVATDTGRNTVALRAAVAVPPARLDEEAAFTDWVDFGRPAAAGDLLEASVEATYADGSDDTLSALLTVRDEGGRVFHRALEGRPDDTVVDPDVWSDWQDFLDQP